MEKKFVLDDKSFKALSADSRINILKNLIKRKMTLSELSTKLALKSSTIKEHCELLMNAELIDKIDEGRKWKYYELTNKGKQIISPNPFDEVKILVMLCFGAIIFSLVLLTIMQGFLTQGFFLDIGQQDNITILQTNQNELGIMEIDTTTESINETITISGINYNFFAISIMIALIIGIFSGWIVGKRT